MVVGFLIWIVAMNKMMMPLKRYAQFSGRASRAEFWWFQLFCCLVLVPLNVLQIVAASNGWSAIALIGTAVSALFSLAILVPALAATMRRLHDTDRSGWWLLAMFVPIVGLIPLVFTLLPGDSTSNRYGAPVPHP
ncbi:Inner membrane protein YhaI [compost metagenome]